MLVVLLPQQELNAQKHMADDVRLDRFVSARLNASQLGRALDVLSRVAGVAMAVNGKGTRQLPIAFSYSNVRIKYAMEAIHIVHPQLEWTSNASAEWQLHDMVDAKHVAFWNRARVPQTPERRALFEHGREFLAQIKLLSRARRASLNNGVLFSSLPVEVRVPLQRMFRAFLADPEFLSRRRAFGESALPHTWVQFYAERREDYNQYHLNFVGANGNVPFSFNDFKPKPVPAIKVRDHKAEARERARLLEEDPRFAKKLTLRLKNVGLGAVLQQISRRADLDFAWDGDQRHPNLETVNISAQPLKRALQTLADLYQFEWDRSPGGMLIVRKGRFEPYLLARGDAERQWKKLAEDFEKLSPAERSKLENGSSFDGLEPHIRSDIAGVFSAWSTVSPKYRFDLAGSTTQLRPVPDSMGRSLYELQAKARNGNRYSIVFER